MTVRVKKTNPLVSQFTAGKKINMSLISFKGQLVYCDLGLDNATLGLQLQASFSRPWSQFFTIRTSQLARSVQKLPFKNTQ